jgi:hypothetical protein
MARAANLVRVCGVDQCSSGKDKTRQGNVLCSTRDIGVGRGRKRGCL